MKCSENVMIEVRMNAECNIPYSGLNTNLLSSTYQVLFSPQSINHPLQEFYASLHVRRCKLYRLEDMKLDY